MKDDQPKAGRPGETSQWPRWQGPAESRPSGYLPGETNIFAKDQQQEVHRGKGPKGYRRSDGRIEEDVNEQLTQDAFLDPTDITVSVKDGVVTLNGHVASRADKRRAEDCALQVHGVSDCLNNLRIEAERH